SRRAKGSSCEGALAQTSLVVPARAGIERLASCGNGAKALGPRFRGDDGIWAERAMNRIDTRFAALRARGRTGLIPFITAGDPAPDATVPIMHALVAAGADLLELGVPFSDPMADGPVIQHANERALARGVGL